MATVVDAARAAQMIEGDYTETYQKGNDHADTPNPTWMQQYAIDPTNAETSIPKGAPAGVNNTADAWVPHISQTFLPSVPKTERFTGAT